jgi:predicted dehydrogenase
MMNVPCFSPNEGTDPEMTPLRIGVVGVGHLGKEHARILSTLPDVELVGVADANADQAKAIAQRCSTKAFFDYQSLIPLLDAAVIVTPTIHHHAVASAFLRRGIPLLVEKPLAPTLAAAEKLVDLANLAGVVLQTGHIERFNPAFEDLKHRPLRPRFIMGQRLGTFSGRSADIGAVLDLMIHDLDLTLALVGSPVTQVEALGVSVLGGHEDMAHARLTFANGCVADLSASRISLQPSRQMQIWASEGYASIDFAKRSLTIVQPSTALKLHRSNLQPFNAATRLTLKEDLIGKHLQVLERDCNHGDQLTRELQDFIHCIRTGSRPRVSGEDGRDAVALAVRVLESLRFHAWEGDSHGPCGPLNLPPALGALFIPPADEKAA